MINNYVECNLSKRKEFRTDFACKIAKVEMESIFNIGNNRSGIKIDTGAQGTLVPLRTLGWTDTQINKLIETTYKNNINAFSVVRGVESNNTKTITELQNMTLEEIKKYKGIAIQMKTEFIKIGSFIFNNVNARVTTQTTGNILLGMDIMKDWDIHIGKDINTHETLFLACPYNSINDEYLTALENHFGIGTIVNSALVRKSKI